MKTIEIFLPADNINLTASDGVTLITYSGVYGNKPKMYSYTVIGEFTHFEQNGNLLTLK
jgi:hypothetical protein